MARERPAAGLPAAVGSLTRRAGIGAVVVAGAATLVTIGMLARDDEPAGRARTGSVVVDGRGSAMEFMSRPPTAYSVTYRVEEPEGSVGQQRIVVNRPWRSVITDGGTTQLSDFGAIATRPAGGSEAAFTAPPGLAVGDARPEVALPAAVAAGTAELGERRRVLGTDCQVYKTRFPLDAGPVTAPGPDRTESCVDRRGLVLEELLVVDDEPVQRRIATGVEIGLGITDSEVEISDDRPSVDDGGAGLRPLATEDAARLAQWTLGDPDGFTRRGTYAVVHPRSDATDDPRAAAARLATVTTVWTRGADVVIFEAGTTIDGSPVAGIPGSIEELRWPAGPDGRSPGPARLVLSARGNELRHTDGGVLVRLMGTVAPDELLAIASAVRPSGVPE